MEQRMMRCLGNERGEGDTWLDYLHIKWPVVHKPNDMPVSYSNYIVSMEYHMGVAISYECGLLDDIELLSNDNK